MRRLLPLLVVGFLLVGVGATPALALSEPQSTLLRQISPADLKAFINSPDFVANPANNTNATVQTGVHRMQLASGRLTALRALGTVGVVATGSVIVWKIADAAGVGGFVYKKITGTDTHTYSTATNLRWHCLGTGTDGCTSASIPPYSSDPYGWRFRSDQDTDVDWTPSYGAVGTIHTGVPSGGGTCNGSAANLEFCAAALAMGSTTDWYVQSTSGDYYIMRSATAMENAVTIQPSDAAEFASPPAGATTRTAGTNDTSTLTDPELEAALDRIDPNPGTAGTALEQATAEAILDELEPGWAEGFLLQPLPNETYTQYITRLQEAGWVGDATSTELATETPGYGPEAVVRVIATPVGGTTTVYDPLGWPSPSPTIAIDADITIRYNPDTAPEAPTTATPTPITGAPTTIPETPALDFSPLTDIDFGCKFPYGFLCYAVDVTETFDVSPDAPRFVFDVPTVNVGITEFGGGDDGWVVDLQVMDDWAAIWRDIWSVVIVIGAVYLVATRLLGFKAGGDPGAAMDDV